MTFLPAPGNSRSFGGEMETERKNSRLEVEHYDLEILLRRPSLRSNIPRKTSRAKRETVKTEETTCGFGCIRNEWIQSFANRNAFIFIYGLLGTFYGSYHAYFNGTITTLEKRFRLPSQTIGLIATTSGFVQIIASLVLSFRTPKTNTPRWIGLGTYLIIGSTIISALPNFLYGPGFDFERFKNSTNRNDTFRSGLCTGQSDCIYKTREKNISITLLIVAQILHGLGGSLYLTLGKSYKEVNVGKHQGPALSSFLSIFKTLGPAFGYWLSSMCLKFYVSPKITPLIDENDPRWLGAWWLGNLVIGFIFLVPATLVILFPTTLPKAAAIKIFKIEETKEGDNFEAGKDDMNLMRHFFVFIISNYIDFNGIFNILGFMAYFIFLPKYVEIQYRLSASNANLIAGSITLILSAFGTVVASSVITKNRPNARILAGWNVFVGLLSMGSLISYIFYGCPANDEQIKAMAAQLLDIQKNPNCVFNEFSPVCNKFGESFISPCYAGCEDVYYTNITKVYCKCNLPHTNKTASPGICPVDCHFNFLVFIIITSSTTFFYATSRSSDIWFEIKYKEKKEMFNEFNFAMALLSTLAFASSPILFGYILDVNCLLWEKNYSDTGNCWLYDNENLRFAMNLTSVAFVLLGVIFNLGTWFLVKNLELFNDNDYYTEEYYED